MATKPKVGQINSTKPRFVELDDDISAYETVNYYTPQGAKPEAPVEARSTMRAVGDLATQVGTSLVGGVRMMSDMFGADNRVSQGLRSAEEALGGLLSAQAVGDQRKISEIMKEAEGKGWTDQVAAGLKAAGVAPGALMAQALGTSIPTLATALIPGAGPAAIATRLGAAGLVGASQGAGNIKGVIYEDVKKELAKANPGMPPEEIEARAVEAQSFAGPNAGQIALGGALGVAAGTTGVEKVVSGLRNGVTRAPAGIMGRMLGGGAAEAVPEFGQGGQEKYASNTALNNEGFQVDPMSGVIAQGTMEAAAGFGAGALTGIPKPKQMDPAAQAADLLNTNLVPETGPLGRAANAGTKARANTLAQTGVDPMQPASPAQDMVDDPVSDRINQIPDEAERTQAAKAYAVLGKQGVAKGIAQSNQKLFDRIMAKHGLSLDGEEDGAANAVRPVDSMAAGEGAFDPTAGMGVTPGVVGDAGVAVEQPGVGAPEPDMRPVPLEPGAGIELTAAQPAANQLPDAGNMVPQGVDPATGEGGGYAAPNAAQPPDIIGRRIGKRDNLPFSIQSVAQKNLEKRGLTGTHEVVSATNIDQNLSGFLIVRKPEGAAPVAAPVPETAKSDDWKVFTPESGTLNVPREEMPQVKNIHRGPLVNFLGARGVTSEQVEIDPAELKPTQDGFSQSKVDEAADADTDRAILISSDNHIIDGHHQAVAKLQNGQPVRAIRLNAPAADLLPMVLEFPSATTAKPADVPETDFGNTAAAKPRNDAEIIANAVAYADGLGLTDKNERKEAILGDLSNAWGMTKDEVESDPAVKAALKQKPSLAAKEKNAGRVVENIKKQALDASKKMQDEIDAQTAPAQAQAVTAESAAPVTQPATSGVPEEGSGGSQPPQAAPTQDQNGAPKRQSKAQKAEKALAEILENGLTKKSAEEVDAAIKDLQDVNIFDLNDADRERIGAQRIAAENELYKRLDALKAEKSNTSDKRVDETAKNERVAEDAKPEAPTPEAKAEPEPAKEAEQAKPAKIEDSGEVLEGARKLYAKSYAAKLDEGTGMETASVPLSKSWPEPDYQRLIAEGTDPWAVALARAVRDEIPTKPTKAWKLKGWVAKVEGLREMAQRVMDGSLTRERFTEEAAKYKLDDWLNKVDLYEAVGHAESLKGMKFAENTYSFFGGQKFDPPKKLWTVNAPSTSASATWSNGNWGNDLVVADTKAEAVEKFKAWVAEQAAKAEDGQGKPVGKRTEFNVYSYRNNPKVFIVGKRISATKSIDLMEFESAKDARAFIAANQDKLETMLAEAKTEQSERREENAPRVGDDHRSGGDVTTEQFRETFGFRGEQFGASMPQGERQANLNQAYDALMDLAGVIGVPPKALSLNGELGLAFGARGHGGKNPAMAHYEADTTGAVTPNRVVINLTRKNGAGSLAHEWFHAVDNYFARMRGEKGGMLTESYPAKREGVRPEMVDAFKRVMSSIQATGVRERAKNMDKKRTKDYWSTGIEMAARSFESYVIAKLQDKSGANDYLANILPESAWLRENEYPYPTMGELPLIRAAFDNFFATVQTKETDKGVAMFSRGQATQPFYSALSREAESLNLKSAPAVGWNQALLGLVKNGKVKQDEIEWSGLKDWLGLQTGKVSKEDVMAFLDANGVQVQEVVLGGKQDTLPNGYTVIENPEFDPADKGNLTDTWDFLDDDTAKPVEPRFLVVDKNQKRHGTGDTSEDAIQDFFASSPIRDTKYAKYTLPGGENYREVLLTLPSTEKSLWFKGKEFDASTMTDAERNRWVRLSGVAEDGNLEKNEVAEWSALNDKLKPINNYKSSHWDQPNVLAHIRLNDRTDADGNKVLFVEEIQSDWGQDGKKKGFAPSAKERAEIDAITKEVDAAGGFVSASPELQDRARAAGLRLTQSGVPAAPFVAATDKWLNLALKRVITMAVDGGYDRVAFVNGEQSADRYDLSKSISEINYEPAGEGLYEINAKDMDGKTVLDEDEVTLARIEELVGKEIAKKIEAGEGTKSEGGYRDWRKLSGLDLKVGGEGMKAFYDKIVPNAVNTLLKKVGGGQIDGVDFGKEETFDDYLAKRKLEMRDGKLFMKDANVEMSLPSVKRQYQESRSEEAKLSGEQPGFTITPAMREKASGGLPLFAKGQMGQGMTKADAQDVVTSITSRWANAPEVVVVQDMQDPAVPEAARQEDARQKSQGASGEPEGFFYGGKVYIVAGQLTSPGNVMRVLFHESLGHYGLRGTFGSGLTPILKQLAAFRRPDIVAKARGYGLVRNGADGKPVVDVKDKNVTDDQIWAAMDEVHRLTAAEEVLAEMAQSQPNIGYVKRAIAVIRAFLRKHVPGFAKMKMTDEDIIANFILPARKFVERGPGGGPGGGPKGGVFFSRVLGENSPPKTIEVDGVQRPTLNSNGQSIHPTEEGVRNFWRWFGESKVVDEQGRPMVVYHGTKATELTEFDKSKMEDGGGAWFSSDLKFADGYRMGVDKKGRQVKGDLVSAYLRIENPSDDLGLALSGKADGYKKKSVYAVNDPTQIKSTSNNGDFDGTNPDIRFSRTMGATELAGQMRDKLNETFNHPGKLSWWHKTVGSQYNLAERNPAFKKVFDAAQSFINDVSYYGTEAANMAPKILPKLETLKDLTKTAISAADNKAVAAPVFEGTLSWTRGPDGKPVRIEDGDTKTRPGVRWADAELKSIFKLTDEQVELYKEFRAATDTSLDNMAKAQMLREAGKDVADLRDMVMEAPDVDTAAKMLRELLLDLAKDDPDRADVLTDAAAGVLDTAAKINDLKKQGYAPLSRFGRFTVDVVVDGQRQYFGLFESEADSNKMADKMRMEFGAENVAQGTMSQKEFELFQGITPESLELFGNMMGLSSTGNEEQDKAFQTYLKLTKNNRSAMKRLIHRQGIAGYSEDVGRVLAAFVYANARQTSAALHIGQMDEAITAIPKGEGELKDHALELAKYIKEPREEAAALRGLLFAQYLGGSVASAMVNFTQPLTVSIPYLSQFGGLAKAGKAWAQAVADMKKGAKLEAGLERALKYAEESGVVSPQEVHQLMAQARGAATLQSGDGTRKGDAIAMAKNGWTRAALAWGKLFGYAEQVNRRSTFIAAYRLAVDQKIDNPGAFAEKAVNETQFINNKANKMKYGRGAIGATLMTFKSYSLNWLELMHRLSTQDGKEGKLAAAYMLGALFLVAGAGGLPFAEDAEDLIDAIGQKMGYNFSTKKAKQEFIEGLFGKTGAQFVERGLTGIPGVPIDISGRMGMQNLIPGTGLLLDKRDSSRDAVEVLGPAADLAKRAFQAVGKLVEGEVFGAEGALMTAAPRAVANVGKGVDMLDTGMYRDTKGAKVIDTTEGEALAKMIGFQPQSVSKVQESNYINQRAKDFYSLKTQEIRAKWAMGIFEGDQDKVKEARQMMDDWNQDNPDQKMTANMPAIIKKVREMRKDKAQRIADTAPKAMRAQMRADARELAGQ